MLLLDKGHKPHIPLKNERREIWDHHSSVVENSSLFGMLCSAAG